MAASPVVVWEDAAIGLVVLEAVVEAVGLVSVLDGLAVVDLVAAGLIAVVELVTFVDWVVTLAVVIGAIVTLGLTSEVKTGPFFKGGGLDAPEASLDVMAGEAVLELVADLTAPIFLSSLAEAMVRLEIFVVGTGALVVAAIEQVLSAGLVEVVVLDVLGAVAEDEFEEVIVIGLVLDDGAAGFFVAGAVVIDDMVIDLVIVDFEAGGALGPVVNLVSFGLAVVTVLAPDLLNDAPVV